MDGSHLLCLKAVRQESFEDGKEQGIVIDEERGIRIFIEDKLEDHVPEETIIHKLMTKYELTKQEAMEYIEKYRI